MLYVNIAETFQPDWRFVEPYVDDPRLDWSFSTFQQDYQLRSRLFRLTLPKFRAIFAGVGRARRSDDAVLVSHLPHMSRWTNLLRDRFAPSRPHIAFAFNFTDLPQSKDRLRYARALRSVDEFVVPSGYEVDLYSSYFDLAPERFVFLRWWGETPRITETTPAPFDAPYLCAVGGEGRDHATLMEAARRMPEVSLAVIARPWNLKGLDVPDNVRVYVNLPGGETWAIAHRSQGMILPLRDGRTPNGHVTIVGAQLLGIPLVITESAGITDYADDRSALMIAPQSVEDMMQAMRRLLDDPAGAAALAKAGQTRARSDYDPQHWVDYFTGVEDRLQRRGRLRQA